METKNTYKNKSLTLRSEASPSKYHRFFMTFLGRKSEGFTLSFTEFRNTTWSGGIILRIPSSIFLPGPEEEIYVYVYEETYIQVTHFFLHNILVYKTTLNSLAKLLVYYENHLKQECFLILEFT